MADSALKNSSEGSAELEKEVNNLAVLILSPFMQMKAARVYCGGRLRVEEVRSRCNL